MVAVVERSINLVLRPGKEQALALRIFADCVHRRVIGKTIDDLGPGLAAVVRAQDVGPHVIQAQCIDGRVCGLRIEMSGVQNGDLGEGHQLRRRDVFPMQPAILRHVDQAVIGSRPDAIDVQRRRRYGINYAAPRRLRARLIAIFANIRRYFPTFPRQVGADLLPAVSAVARLPQGIGGEVKNVWIDRREQHRRGA